MLNVITSAIVNTPPPPGAAKMVSFLSGNKHRTLHKEHTDEKMIPLFTQDTDGTKLKRPFVLARRNYAAIIYNEHTGELNFEFRVEKAPGVGAAVPYTVASPPPRYGAKSAAPSIAPSGASAGAPSFTMPSAPVTPVTATGPPNGYK